MAGAARETAGPALELRGLVKSFGGVHALEGLSLRVRGGERVALIGPNGAGKSTLLAIVAGELRADAGEVLLEGRRLAPGTSPQRRARLGLGRTFQSARPFAGLTVRENVELALIAAGSARAAEGGRKGGRKGGREGGGGEAEPAAALAEVGLERAGGLPAGALAHGERKRLELAMVLATRPRVLLLDEPTAGTGAGEREALMELIVAASERRGAAVLFSEHDMDAVFAYAQRVVAIDRGRTIADGPPGAVRADACVRRVYLGAGPGPARSGRRDGGGG